MGIMAQAGSVVQAAQKAGTQAAPATSGASESTGDGIVLHGGVFGGLAGKTNGSSSSTGRVKVFEYGSTSVSHVAGNFDSDAIVRVEYLSGETILEETLPVFNVNVTRTIDLATSKAFSSDIWVANFGEAVTSIVISGVSLMKLCNSGGSLGSPNAVIDTLIYLTMMKVPVRICVSSGFGANHTACYNGVLSNATLEASSDTSIKVGKSGTYTLRFIAQKIR